MKKSEIPKPKHDIGDRVSYFTPSEGNSPPRWQYGEITRVQINISAHGKFVHYAMLGQEETFDESIVKRR